MAAMTTTRTGALVVAVLALAACDEKPSPSAASSSSASARPPIASTPTPAPPPTSSGPAPEPPPEPELAEVEGDASTTFTFAPEGQGPFTVTSVRVKQKRRGGGEFGREVIGTVKRVTVTKEGDGFAWRVDPVSFSVHGERSSRIDELTEGFAFTLRLDGSGKVASVEGYDGLQAAAKKMLTPRIIERTGPMLKPEALRRTRGVEWQGQLGDLIGKTVSLDEPLVSMTERPMPKGTATVYGVLRFGPWVECAPLGRCLRVEGYQHTSPEALADLTKVPVETIKAAGEHEVEGEPHDHEHDGDDAAHGHEHGGPPHGAPGMGGRPGAPPLNLAVHSVRFVAPSSSLPIWERIEREIDLGIAQLSDTTTSSYDYASKAEADASKAD